MIFECVQQTEAEGEHGRVLLFFLVGEYMEDSLKCSLIIFSDFHLQGVTQACTVFTPIILTVPFLPPPPQ